MISVVKYDKTENSIRRAIELCGGFDALKADHKVMLKPNGVGSDPAIPYFGMMTTMTVVEGIVRALLDFGVRATNITIGEGAALSRELMLNTMLFLRAMGMEKIAKKYGISVIDFNESPKRTVEIGKNKYEIAAPALDTDFMINVPVPKYHEQTTVTLAIKNLKGCLSPDSKKACHSVHLEDNIAEFNTVLPCHLTVVDAIYFLRHGGPFIDTGVPCRKDMIMAGTDRLELDSAGCIILGVDPAAVRHITTYARLTGREADVGKVDWTGDDYRPFVEAPFAADKELFYNSFKNSRVTGVKMQHPGTTWCTGCNISLRAALYLLCKDNTGRDFESVEIIAGKQRRAEGDYEKTILFGDCPIKVNAGNAKIKSKAEIPGCPPTFLKSYPAMMKYVLPRGTARKQVAKNLALGALSRTGLYKMTFPFLSDLPDDEFDPRDFGRG